MFVGRGLLEEVCQKSLYSVDVRWKSLSSNGWGKDLGNSSQLTQNCTIDKYAYYSARILLTQLFATSSVTSNIFVSILTDLPSFV